MFDFDTLHEIISTVKKNKLRTFLTGFSVAWGIFMLIILVGSGNGLKNGMSSNFSDISQNAVFVKSGNTTMPYKGMALNRTVQFKDIDYANLRSDFPQVELASALIMKDKKISYNDESGSYSVQGVYPENAEIETVKMLKNSGRFINDVDIQKQRKVIVITSRIKEVLFKGQDPLGKYVNVDGLMFLVVGVSTRDNNSNNLPAFIPFSTAQALYNSGIGLDQMSFTVSGINSEKAADEFEQRFREKLGARHNFAAEDKSALRIWNTAKDFIMFNGIFDAINIVVIFVSIMTLIAGIVGISNIMLITVAERKREFGIRKALGATPGSILRLVIFESILITAIFGYVGMITGIGVTEGINAVIEASASAGSTGSEEEMSIFKDPTVSVSTVLGATGLLIAAGILAGFFPAYKATKVTAIEAMRAE